MWTEPLYTAEEMKQAEAGHDVSALMERAGKAVADYALDQFAEFRTITVVCGPGNNGGDGRIAARLLEGAGRSVRIVEAKPEDEPKELGEPGLIIDALFGTGFTGEPRPAAARLIEQMNAADAEIVAVDIPSGVDASTGEVAGAAVEAAATIGLHGEKVGVWVSPGKFLAGLSERADIGLEDVETAHARVTKEVIHEVPLKGRHRPETKYTAGSVLVVGGSPGMTGAAALTSRAALRADAGYVAVAAPAASLPVLETLVIEAVKRPLEQAFEAAERAGALAIGPGLGRGEEQQRLVRRLLEEVDLPAVVDADALHQLEPFSRRAATVLTPHAGELARLLGVESAWVDAHRLEALRRAVDRFQCVVLLKGSDTLIGSPGAQVLVSTGFTSLATAGTGDVLTGIISAFLAKGMEPRLAAAAATMAHSGAAVIALVEDNIRAGMIASDVVEALPRVFR